MNLLPKEDQKIIRKERLKRFIVLSAVSFALVAVFAWILLLPSYLILFYEGQFLEHKLNIAEKDTERKKIEELESEISGLNKKLDILKRAMQNRQEPSRLFQEIIAQKPRGVKLDILSYEEAFGRVSLQGRAKARNDLLAFVKALENDVMFSRVVSPIANLLEGEDTSFSLVLEFSKKQ